MRRVRIKKDLTCAFSVITNGQPAPLEGRDLSLILVDPKYKKTPLDFTVDGNIVRFKVGHDLQHFVGVYNLELWENYGKSMQSVVDKRSAFELVNYTTQEDDGNPDDIATAELLIGTGTLAVGIKGEKGDQGEMSPEQIAALEQLVDNAGELIEIAEDENRSRYTILTLAALFNAGKKAMYLGKPVYVTYADTNTYSWVEFAYLDVEADTAPGADPIKTIAHHKRLKSDRSIVDAPTVKGDALVYRKKFDELVAKVDGNATKVEEQFEAFELKFVSREAYMELDEYARELSSRIGFLSSLKTAVKNTIVDAINWCVDAIAEVRTIANQAVKNGRNEEMVDVYAGDGAYLNNADGTAYVGVEGTDVTMFSSGNTLKVGTEGAFINRKKIATEDQLPTDYATQGDVANLGGQINAVGATAQQAQQAAGEAKTEAGQAKSTADQAKQAAQNADQKVTDLSSKVGEKLSVKETKENGNIVLQDGNGNSKEFMAATPSGDPMHYAYIAAGALWNQITGFWELNGLTDINNLEMSTIYVETAHSSVTSFRGLLCDKKSRTNFPITNSALVGMYLGPSDFDNVYCLMYNARKLEVFTFTAEGNSNINLPAAIRYFSVGADRLREIRDVLNIGATTSVSQAENFLRAPNLESVKVKSTKVSLNLSSCAKLNNESILYLLNNAANTSAIVITLHADAYNRAVADTDIQAALISHPTISLVSA